MRKNERLIRLSEALSFLRINGNGLTHHRDYSVWQETVRLYDSIAQQLCGKDDLEK